jgi:hypothetical protein
MKLEGSWEGEFVYDERCRTELTSKPVNFSLTVSTHLLSGLFEGTCKESPLIKDQALIALIYGKVRINEIFFTKRYPFTFGFDQDGKFISGKEPHPEIYFTGVYSDKKQFYGSWRMEPTFRKIDGHLCEILPSFGFWWMKKTADQANW